MDSCCQWQGLRGVPYRNSCPGLMRLLQAGMIVMSTHCETAKQSSMHMLCCLGRHGVVDSTIYDLLQFCIHDLQSCNHAINLTMV